MNLVVKPEHNILWHSAEGPLTCLDVEDSDHVHGSSGELSSRRMPGQRQDTACDITCEHVNITTDQHCVTWTVSRQI